MNFGCLLMYSISKSKILKITILQKIIFQPIQLKSIRFYAEIIFYPEWLNLFVTFTKKKKCFQNNLPKYLYQKDYLNSRMGNSPIWYFRSWKSKKVQSSCSILLLWLHPRTHGRKILLHQNKEFAHSWFTFYFKFYILL